MTATPTSTADSVDAHHPLIIIGSGIAGYTAGIYAGRADNDPLILKGDEPGGQLTLTTDVANYPGFEEGISGPELVNRMQAQAERFGATVTTGIVDEVARDSETGQFTVSVTDGSQYTADAVIAASGASARTLGLPGEDKLMGYGVSTCATCDGAFFRGEDMIVVGGGDAAFEEASFLTKFADTVHLIHRREGFRAEEYWVETVENHIDNDEIALHVNTEVTEIHGSEEAGVDEVALATHPDGYPSDKRTETATDEWTLDVGAVFIAIGHTPNTDYLTDLDGVELDETGYINTYRGSGGGQTRTGVPGLFAAGDVVDTHYQQAVTAAGMGCKAALDADDYLSDD